MTPLIFSVFVKKSTCHPTLDWLIKQKKPYWYDMLISLLAEPRPARGITGPKLEIAAFCGEFPSQIYRAGVF